MYFYNITQVHVHLTLREFVNVALRFVLMLRSRGSLHVMRAMPAVRWRTMWWAARCIRWMSGSRAKSWRRERARERDRERERERDRDREKGEGGGEERNSRTNYITWGQQNLGHKIFMCLETEFTKLNSPKSNQEIYNVYTTYMYMFNIHSIIILLCTCV